MKFEDFLVQLNSLEFQYKQESDERIHIFDLAGKLEGYVFKKDGQWAIAIDYIELIEKCELDDCPINVDLPKNTSEYEYLVDRINWLDTDEGFKASDEWDKTKWVRDYSCIGDPTQASLPSL